MIANGLNSSYLNDALVRFRRTLTGMSDDLGRHEWMTGRISGSPTSRFFPTSIAWIGLDLQGPGAIYRW
jgi:hypothetical protein